MLLNATQRVDAEGAIVGVVGVGQDITKLSHAQAKTAQVTAPLHLAQCKPPYPTGRCGGLQVVHRGMYIHHTSANPYPHKNFW